MEKYKDRIVHYVYRPRWKLVGRLVYDESRLAPLKGEVKVNALYLGESFSEQNEFLKRIDAVKRQDGS
jgi:hypothetical protein